MNNKQNKPTRDEIERVQKYLSSVNSSDLIQSEDARSIQDYMLSASKLVSQLARNIASNKITIETELLLNASLERADELKKIINKYLYGEL